MRSPALPAFLLSAAAACALLATGATPAANRQAEGDSASPIRATRGPVDVVWAADGDANYAYGASRTARAARAALAPTASIVLVPDAALQANAPAMAAFRAAADIWAGTIVSNVPIRVAASYRDMGSPFILGAAGPTIVCARGGTFYAAALYDKLEGGQACAAAGGASTEIEAEFNSTFAWDFGTTGTPVPGRMNFMTVVLHELGHGLGFFGSMDADSLSGTFRGSYWNTPIVYDRFAVTGAGAALLNFVNGSTSLAAQLVSNDTYFDGAGTRSANAGQRAKLETHNFTTAYGISSDHGFLPGSSYSHLDDVLYSPNGSGAARPNGLMTFQLQRAEVYMDPGPLVRGMFQDMGWTVVATSPPVCTFTISPTAYSAPATATSSSLSLTTGAGCPWTAVIQSGFISITSAAAGSSSASIAFTVAANASTAARTGTLLVAGQTFTVTQAGLDRSPDVDGDGQADLTVFRPSSNEWLVLRSTSNYGYSDFLSLQWGIAGDRPLAADFDGDGRMDVTVYRPSTGQWFIRYSSRGYSYAYDTYQWGLSGDIPLVADFDGDARSDLAVYRPTTGQWFIRQSSTNYSDAIMSFQWGLPGDQPIATDFDGDRRTDLVVYRPTTGEWFIRFSSNGFAYETAAWYAWGLPGDLPLAADFDGDRKTDLAVFRPSNGTWFIRNSMNAYAVANWTAFQWGLPDDVPVVADVDGDGRTDIVVYRPSTGEWFIRYSASGYASSRIYVWGLPGDVPLIPGKR